MPHVAVHSYRKLEHAAALRKMQDLTPRHTLGDTPGDTPGATPGDTPGATMPVIAYRGHGGVQALRLEAWPVPVPGPGEVRVRVRACALNGFDPMMLAGSTGLSVPMPMVPCGDVAGEVDACGAGAEAFAPGTRVLIDPVLPGRGMMGEVTPGGAAGFVCVPAQSLVPMPAGVAFEAAAALPVAYGTAWRMLAERGRVQAGETMFVLGAGGGVGVACVQLGQRLGARVIAAATGAAKCDRLLALGAEHAIDLAAPQHAGGFRKALHALVGKPSYTAGTGGVEVLVNYLGGDTWAEGLKCVRRHGRVLVCGATLGHDPKDDLRYLWSFEQTVIGSNGWQRSDLEALLGMVAAGELEPVIDSVRPLAALPEAMQALIERRVFGKAVLRVD
jgi:alcohol dehydrogenase